MISLDEALRTVLAAARPLASETVALSESLDRVLAEDVTAAMEVPGFDNSAMDGFAVRPQDTDAAPVELSLVGESRAGRPYTGSLRPGEAIGISTGAMVPPDAGAIVRLERAVVEDGRVRVDEPVRAGADVRRAGEDVQRGSTVVRAGTVLGPVEAGVLASVGCCDVCCVRLPRVAVLTSGDELRTPGEDLPAGAINDSNRYSLQAAVRRSHGRPSVGPRLRDNHEATRRGLEAALRHDMIVTCGGVSVGAHDHVPAALRELGVEEAFSGVAIKPGRPMWFGTRGPTLVFGLPGNPVSAMVCFQLLVRPALAVLAGRQPAQRLSAALAADVRPEQTKTKAVPCRLSGDGHALEAHPGAPAGSHVLTALLGADGLALVPPGSDVVAAGSTVEVEPL